MTIYALGSEPAILGMTAATVITDPGDYCDWRLGRCAIIVSQQPVGIALPSEFGANSLGGWWVHYRYQFGPYSMSNGAFSGNMFVARNASGQIMARLAGSDNGITPYLLNNTGGASTAGAEYVGSPASLVWFFDFHNYTQGGANILEIYINGALTWMVVRAGETNGGVRHLSWQSGWPNYSDPIMSGYLSEVIVSDQDTRGKRVKTLYPLADGAHTDFAGTFSDINAPTTDLSFIASDTVGAKYSYQFGNYANVSGVEAVVVNGCCAGDGTKDLRALLRIGGVDYVSGALGVGSGLANRNAVFTTDPSTEAPWAGVVGVEAGFEVIAL